MLASCVIFFKYTYCFFYLKERAGLIRHLLIYFLFLIILKKCIFEYLTIINILLSMQKEKDFFFHFYKRWWLVLFYFIFQSQQKKIHQTTPHQTDKQIYTVEIWSRCKANFCISSLKVSLETISIDHLWSIGGVQLTDWYHVNRLKNI